MRRTKYIGAKQGWYRLVNPEKYRQPLDETMKSTRDGFIQYKSSLEMKAIRYADAHPGVEWWSMEPFPIHYIKPTDGKVHRYFPDLLVKQGEATIVIEVKHSSEVKPPSRTNVDACLTYAVNQAKWAAARKFCKEHGLYFCILTEKDL